MNGTNGNDAAPPCAAIYVAHSQTPTGQFTARALGVPEMQATAASREEAIDQLRRLLARELSAGNLTLITLPSYPSALTPVVFPKDDALEQEFLEALARDRQEDLERTLREYEQEDHGCSNTSSTPTT